MHILKFGGTSMVDEDSWRRVLDIIKTKPQPIVVVSATARTTRQLAKAAQTAINNFDESKQIGKGIKQRHQTLINNFLDHSTADERSTIRTQCLRWIDERTADLHASLNEINQRQKVTPSQKDAILSLGEQLSAYLFALCGRAYGLKTTWIDARSIIKTDAQFGSAQPNLKKIKAHIDQLKQPIDQDMIPIMGGFYGENKNGVITTLGFEGSDYTASLIGAALNAAAIEIWTDVSGIFTCDPHTIENARLIERLSFDDAKQLALHGAKVLHPSTIEPAATNDIPITVKNIFDPDSPGTRIDSEKLKNGLCKAIAYIENVTALQINTANHSIRDHRLIEVYAILEEYESSIVAINTGKQATVAVLDNPATAQKLYDKIAEVGPAKLLTNQGIITLIGCNTSTLDQLNKQVNHTLSSTPVSFSFAHKPQDTFHIVLDEQEILPTVKTLHKTLF